MVSQEEVVVGYGGSKVRAVAGGRGITLSLMVKFESPWNYIILQER